MKERFMVICTVVCLCFAASLSRVGVKTAMTLAQDPAGVEDNAPVFIVDAGHGGFDGGAVGVQGVVEKDVNLEIARYVYTMLCAGGYNALMSRDADVALEDTQSGTIRTRKRDDINARAKLLADTENGVLLSIHQNNYHDPTCSGAQVFYGQGHPESVAFAQVMQETLRSQVDPENSRKEKPITESVYLVHTAKKPALLIECGFLSNAKEAQKLQQPAYQQKIAFAIYCAAAQWAAEYGQA